VEQGTSDARSGPADIGAGGGRSPAESRRASGRWHFLADASTALDASLDYEETLANVVRLAVPEVADYSYVALVNEDGSMRWGHSAHRDPARHELVEALRAYQPHRDTPDHPTSRAIRTGEPQIQPRVDDKFLARVSRDEHHLALLRALSPASVVVVPLIARERVFGTIVFATTPESGRHYNARDFELAREVGRRAAFAIDHALLYQAAERAAQARDELMAVVAHDLKNPLSTIQLATGFLLEEIVPNDPTHQLEREQLAAVRRAAERMYRLIHDLLDLSGADAGRLLIEPKSHEAAELLRDAVDMHRPLADAKGITLEATAGESLPCVLADRERIAQVFSNLIGNALKFTPRGGRVRLGTSRGTEDVHFVVQDTGPGIAPEDQAHVFDRFWQAKKTARMGTGLGLAIAKAIVESHGGSIGVESTPGAGSTFYFSLPVAERAGEQERRRDPSAVASLELRD
jgi:signal transduction histidine kinase